VVEQAIRFPTDLSLLNKAREFTEQIIDTLCKNLPIDAKPRTYRQKKPARPIWPWPNKSALAAKPCAAA